MADYPNTLPTLPVVGGNNFPRSAHINASNREIEAICTELGVNPLTLNDSQAPSASPASFAVLMDMMANIVKTMSGASVWNSASVPMRKIIGGNGNGSQVGSGATNYVGINQWLLSATENLTEIVVPYRFSVTKLMIATGIAAAQPGTGSLVYTLRKNHVDTSMTITVPASASSLSYRTATGAIQYFPGDILSLKAVNGASSSSTSTHHVVLELDQKG